MTTTIGDNMMHQSRRRSFQDARPAKQGYKSAQMLQLKLVATLSLRSIMHGVEVYEMASGRILVITRTLPPLFLCFAVTGTGMLGLDLGSHKTHMLTKGKSIYACHSALSTKPRPIVLAHPVILLAAEKILATHTTALSLFPKTLEGTTSQSTLYT